MGKLNSVLFLIFLFLEEAIPYFIKFCENVVYKYCLILTYGLPCVHEIS
jgi:hypothetical protein